MFKQSMTNTDKYATLAYVLVLLFGSLKFLVTLSTVTEPLNEFVLRYFLFGNLNFFYLPKQIALFSGLKHLTWYLSVRKLPELGRL